MGSKKLISVFLLLTFSVLLVHNVFPHHHHAETETGTIHGLCFDKNHDCDHNENRPEHCHYCSEINFYKIDSPASHQKIRTVIVFVVPTLNSSSNFPLYSESHRYATLKIPSIPLDYYGSLSLRAPPVFI